MSRLINKQMVRATNSGAVDKVHQLLESGASINHLGKDGLTPLMRAAFKGNIELVQFLLTRGADPNQTATDGASALFWACVKGHEPVVERLIAAGADVNAARRTEGRNAGYPPINAAMSRGHLGIAEKLFRAGACLDHRYLPRNIREFTERHKATWLLPLLKKPRRRIGVPGGRR
jgi:ankyrin repeat protein